MFIERHFIKERRYSIFDFSNRLTLDDETHSITSDFGH